MQVALTAHSLLLCAKSRSAATPRERAGVPRAPHTQLAAFSKESRHEVVLTKKSDNRLGVGLAIIYDGTGSNPKHVTVSGYANCK
jgi:hypothetical protein